MNILLVNPCYPDTFWSFKHALKFISKRAAFPPLGLLTVASALPPNWKKKLIDMNTDNLEDADIAWADYVFLGAMGVQQQSTREVIRRCNRLHTKIVAGGPLFATNYKEFEGVDHFVLGEAEAIVANLVTDLGNRSARHIYWSEERPDIKDSPGPAWNLIDTKKYVALSIQYSRGCPFDCDFCNILLLNGHSPRTKGTKQLIGEMEAIYRMGWRNSVFIVDDNFIGNKKKLKAEILPAITDWMKERNYPFTLFTQASIGLSDDEALMRLMVDAGFNRVFIGIETPNEDSLAECGKHQNANRDLAESVRVLLHHGLEVQGGFIVGFDSDPHNIFEKQINFIQQTGIVTAMVGLLNAPRGTRLYQRLQGENRLLGESSGDNTDFSVNFTPRMGHEALISGYRRILTVIYSPHEYYARIGTLLREHHPAFHKRSGMKTTDMEAFLKSIWYLGIKEKGRRYYWRLVISTLLKKRRSLPLVITLAIYGYHFRKLIARYARGLPGDLPTEDWSN